MPAQADQQSHVAGASMGPGLLSHETTPLGVDWSEFMVPGDLDFLNTFDLNTFAL